MSKIGRTLSFLKRNGIKNTSFAVLERLGLFGADPDQLRANAYPQAETKKNNGRDFSNAERDNVKADKDRVEKNKSCKNKTYAQTGFCYSILVPAYETRREFLMQLVDSVRGQTYENWELIVADASATDAVKCVVEPVAREDARVRYVKLTENKGISDNTNAALAHASGDYIGLLDHDDVLEYDALERIDALLAGCAYDIVYTDEDKMSGDGKTFFEPNWKPDFNFDYLLSNNYFCHFTVMRTSLMKKLGFRAAFDGAQDYDLFLRAVYAIEQQRLAAEGESSVPYRADYMRKKIGHVPKVLYHWRAHIDSTADNPESKRYAYEAGKRALEDFIRQNGWNASVRHMKHLGFYEVCYEPDIFSVRMDVYAICGKCVRRHRVTKGPTMDGRELFCGMNDRYSGYLHRAVLMFETEHADESCIIYRDGISPAPETRRTGRMIYCPHITRQD